AGPARRGAARVRRPRRVRQSPPRGQGARPAAARAGGRAAPHARDGRIRVAALLRASEVQAGLGIGEGAARMKEAMKPAAIWALEAQLRSRPSGYPAAFQPVVKGREKRPLGDHFGLKNFGVNLTRLAPGAATALRHAHTLQDEFIYVVEGHPVLATNDGEEWL